MTNLQLVSARPTAAPNGRPAVIVLGIACLTAMWFAYGSAIPYLYMDAERFGIYEPRRDWLIAHIVGGMAALLLGPIQLWLGFKSRHMILHGVLGSAYVLGVGISGVAAFYLALHNDFGWVFGIGFTMLAAVWLTSTAFAVAAICHSLVEQHREWMIRSYVTTFAFVIFRMVAGVLEVMRVGTLTEQLTAASWLCWSVPLFVTEAVLQGRKICRQ